MKKLEIKSGDKFGKLTIIEEVENHKSPCGHTSRQFRCKCECNNEKNISLNNLRSGRSKSCGCDTITKRIIKSTTHNLRYSKEYVTWCNMKQRCYNVNHIFYKYYGSRGIQVCDKWLNSFEEFYKDMGERPVGKTIDRINNDGNYEPNNCRWATPSEQSKNRRKYEKLPSYCQ